MDNSGGEDDWGVDSPGILSPEGATATDANVASKTFEEDEFGWADEAVSPPQTEPPVSVPVSVPASAAVATQATTQQAMSGWGSDFEFNDDASDVVADESGWEHDSTHGTTAAESATVAVAPSPPQAPTTFSEPASVAGAPPTTTTSMEVAAPATVLAPATQSSVTPPKSGVSTIELTAVLSPTTAPAGEFWGDEGDDVLFSDDEQPDATPAPMSAPVIDTTQEDTASASPSASDVSTPAAVETPALPSPDFAYSAFEASATNEVANIAAEFEDDGWDDQSLRLSEVVDQADVATAVEETMVAATAELSVKVPVTSECPEGVYTEAVVEEIVEATVEHTAVNEYAVATEVTGVESESCTVQTESSEVVTKTEYEAETSAQPIEHCEQHAQFESHQPTQQEETTHFAEQYEAQQTVQFTDEQHTEYALEQTQQGTLYAEQAVDYSYGVGQNDAGATGFMQTEAAGCNDQAQVATHSEVGAGEQQPEAQHARYYGYEESSQSYPYGGQGYEQQYGEQQHYYGNEGGYTQGDFSQSELQLEQNASQGEEVATTPKPPSAVEGENDSSLERQIQWESNQESPVVDEVSATTEQTEADPASVSKPEVSFGSSSFHAAELAFGHYYHEHADHHRTPSEAASFAEVSSAGATIGDSDVHSESAYSDADFVSDTRSIHGSSSAGTAFITEPPSSSEGSNEDNEEAGPFDQHSDYASSAFGASISGGGGAFSSEFDGSSTKSALFEHEVASTGFDQVEESYQYGEQSVENEFHSYGNEFEGGYAAREADQYEHKQVSESHFTEHLSHESDFAHHEEKPSDSLFAATTPSEFGSSPFASTPASSSAFDAPPTTGFDSFSGPASTAFDASPAHAEAPASTVEPPPAAAPTSVTADTAVVDEESDANAFPSSSGSDLGFPPAPSASFGVPPVEPPTTTPPQDDLIPSAASLFGASPERDATATLFNSFARPAQQPVAVATREEEVPTADAGDLFADAPPAPAFGGFQTPSASASGFFGSPQAASTSSGYGYPSSPAAAQYGYAEPPPTSAAQAFGSASPLPAFGGASSGSAVFGSPGNFGGSHDAPAADSFFGGGTSSAANVFGSSSVDSGSVYDQQQSSEQQYHHKQAYEQDFHAHAFSQDAHQAQPVHEQSYHQYGEYHQEYSNDFEGASTGFEGAPLADQPPQSADVCFGGSSSQAEGFGVPVDDHFGDNHPEPASVEPTPEPMKQPSDWQAPSLSRGASNALSHFDVPPPVASADADGCFSPSSSAPPPATPEQQSVSPSPPPLAPPPQVAEPVSYRATSAPPKASPPAVAVPEPDPVSFGYEEEKESATFVSDEVKTIIEDPVQSHSEPYDEQPFGDDTSASPFGQAPTEDSFAADPSALFGGEASNEPFGTGGVSGFFASQPGQQGYGNDYYAQSHENSSQQHYEGYDAAQYGDYKQRQTVGGFDQQQPSYDGFSQPPAHYESSHGAYGQHNAYGSQQYDTAAAYAQQPPTDVPGGYGSSVAPPRPGGVASPAAHFEQPQKPKPALPSYAKFPAASSANQPPANDPPTYQTPKLQARQAPSTPGFDPSPLRAPVGTPSAAQAVAYESKPAAYDPNPVPATVPLTSSKYKDPTMVVPSCLASFGFGGNVVTMFPKQKLRLTGAAFGARNSPRTPMSMQYDTAPQAHGELRKGPVSVHRMEHVHPKSADFEAFDKFPGPLDENIPEDTLLSFIEEKMAAASGSTTTFEEDERLLLGVLKVLIKCNGKLRSDANANPSEPSSPEVQLVSLLKESDQRRRRNQPSVFPPPKPVQYPTHPDATVRNASRVRELLLLGDRRAAVDVAIQAQMWPEAMLIASFTDKDEYKRVLCAYFTSHYAAGDPCRALYLSFADQQEKSVHEPQKLHQAGGDSSSSQVILSSWVVHVQMLLANRTADTNKILVELGDRLWKETKAVVAAHVCYLLAGLSVEAPSPSSKMALLGADHRTPEEARYYVSPAAVQRTEIYEYVQRKVNPSATNMIPFQGYKLIYAMTLADHGKLETSFKYVNAMLSMIRAITATMKPGTSMYLEGMQNQLVVLDDRLRQHLGAVRADSVAAAASAKQGKWGLGSALSIMGKIVTRVVEGNDAPPQAGGPPSSSGSLFQGIPKPTANAPVAVPEYPSGTAVGLPAPGSTGSNSSRGFPQAQQAPPMYTPSAPQPPTPAPAYQSMPRPPSAKNLHQAQLDQSAPLSGNGYGAPTPLSGNGYGAPPAGSVNGYGATPQGAGHDYGAPRSGSGVNGFNAPPPMAAPAPPASAPPAPAPFMKPTLDLSGDAGKSNLDKKPLSPSRRASEHIAPKSPRASGNGPGSDKGSASPKFKDTSKKGGRSKTPPPSRSSSGWLTGLSTFIAAKMNPEAKVAKLGEQMEAYFDEEKKRWVFPGETQTEEAKIPSAPPIGPLPGSGPASSSGGGPPSTGAPGPGAHSAPGSMAGGDDPLAALMAPPASRAHASLMKKDPLSAMMAPPSRPAYGQRSSTMPAKRPPRPQFAVFKPAPGSASSTASVDPDAPMSSGEPPASQ